MSKHELVDVLNDDGEVIATVTRHEAESANHTTPNVLIFVFNSKGEVWIQKRPMNKKHFPGLWDISTCGGMVSGETALQTAQREQQEEMGLTCELHFVETFLNVFPGEDGSTRSRLSHLFVGICDEQPKISHEVDEFLAVPYKVLEQRVRANEAAYIPSFLIELEKAVVGYKKLLDK